jgi:hypothetical protein
MQKKYFRKYSTPIGIACQSILFEKVGHPGGSPGRILFG